MKKHEKLGIWRNYETKNTWTVGDMRKLYEIQTWIYLCSIYENTGFQPALRTCQLLIWFGNIWADLKRLSEATTAFRSPGVGDDGDVTSSWLMWAISSGIPAGAYLSRTFFWLVVGLPLWKIWVRQLGWWDSQQKWEKIKFMATRPPTSFFFFDPLAICYVAIEHPPIRKDDGNPSKPIPAPPTRRDHLFTPVSGANSPWSKFTKADIHQSNAMTHLIMSCGCSFMAAWNIKQGFHFTHERQTYFDNIHEQHILCPFITSKQLDWYVS